MIIFPTTTSQHILFESHKIKLNYFLNNFFSSYSDRIHASILQSSFTHFLRPPISIQNEVHSKCISYTNFTEMQKYSNSELCINSCIFLNCKNLDRYAKGGAILFEKSDSSLKVHGCIFDNCHCNGDGGAIFAAAEIGDTNHQGSASTSHENMDSFYSHYCCYSGCSAEIVEKNNVQFSGYGSALFVASTKIELNYSSSFECPNISESSYGAQFDMQTENVKSCFINATSGDSKCCAAIEYRNAKTGFFSFQTIVDQIGGFITSFTKLEGPVNISCCNLVNNTIRYTKYVSTCAIIHVRMKSVTVSDFVVVGTSLEGFQSTNHPLFASKGDDKVDEFFITLVGCFIDNSMNDEKFFEGITTTANFFCEDGESLQTHIIKQLHLGDCEGIVEPPPLEVTSHFSKSNEFSESDAFSYSGQFTSSENFSVSGKFTSSSAFSESINFSFSAQFTTSSQFSASKKFSKSEDFSSTSLFSSSKEFTSSEAFVLTSPFSSSSEFTKSASFTPTGKQLSSSKKFTKSVVFESTSLFSPSTEFTKSSAFSSTSLFSPSKEFTKSAAFSSTSLFSPSKKFTKSASFTLTSLFSPSSEFTKSASFTPTGEQLSPSGKFSESSHPFSKTRANFTESSPFSAMTSVMHRVPPAVSVNTDKSRKDGGLNAPMIGGITGGVAGAAAVASAAFFIIKKKRAIHLEIDIPEASNNSSTEVVMQNPIYGMNMSDDPFQNDFAEHLASLDTTAL